MAVYLSKMEATMAGPTCTLDESIFPLKVVRCTFSFLFHFSQNSIEIPVSQSTLFV